MAKIEIESAFVEPWTKNTEEHPSWGLKTAEAHSKKNDQGTYDTIGRTFRTVKVSRASGIDLSEFRKGDRVHVWGTESTETREFEGKKYYDLIMWADRVERAAGKGANATGAASTGSPARQDAPSDEPWAATPTAPAVGGADVWNTPGNFSDETPF